MSQTQRNLTVAYTVALNLAHLENHRGWTGQPAVGKGLDWWAARAERIAWVLRTRYGVTV